MEHWDKGLVDSSRRALKPLLQAWRSTQHKHSRVLSSSAPKLPFCCFWELTQGKVTWPLAQKAAKLLNLFAVRDWGSCCDHTVREGTTFGNEHSCTESTVTGKTLKIP